MCITYSYYGYGSAMSMNIYIKKKFVLQVKLFFCEK